MRTKFAFQRVVIIILAGVMLTGCVTPIPLAQEAPDVSYKSARSILVAVIDERDFLKEGKPPTFIGRSHSVFGIPVDMQTYPWFVTDKAKKQQPLSQALEERIVFGLNDKGWQLTAADLTSSPKKEDAVSLLASRNAQRLMVLSITQWFVSVNLNWVTAVNFDWGYKLDVLDAQGSTVTHITDSGRDVVDAKADDSYQNLLKLAYRDRLIKILERPEVKNAIQE